MIKGSKHDKPLDFDFGKLNPLAKRIMCQIISLARNHLHGDIFFKVHSEKDLQILKSDLVQMEIRREKIKLLSQLITNEEEK